MTWSEDEVQAEPGEHVMTIVFRGDDLHEGAQRAQGFEVVAEEVTGTVA